MIEVSVILTSFNYAVYIRKALDSLVNQTYKNFEVIIVDDGSKDNSVDIIKEYTEKYQNFHLYTHENNQNKGLIESLKLGIEKSKGEYIAFLESDDYWTLDYLEEKVNCINKNSTAAIIINDISVIGCADSEKYCKDLSIFYKKNNNWMSYVKLFYDNNGIATFSEVMIKSDILRKLDFNSPIPAWTDWWLWRQAVIKNKILYVDKKLTIWNRHEGSYIHLDENSNNEKRLLFIKLSNKLLLNKYKTDYIKFMLYRFFRIFSKSLFSISNEYKENKKYKVITFLWIKLKFAMT